MTSRTLFGSVAVVLAACSGGGQSASGGLEVDDLGGAGPVAAADRGRSTRRMSVAMLRASVAKIAGDDAAGAPIRWQTGTEKHPKDGLVEHAAALGEADYAVVTEENNVPSPLYVKLMDDMARSVCDAITRADAARSPSTRVLSRFSGSGSEPEVSANLEYLLVRFLGVSASKGDPRVAELAGVYQAGAASAAGADSAAEGWRAVCVALIGSPLFHIY